MKKYKKIKFVILIITIFYMIFLLKDIYKEDSIRVMEKTSKLINENIYSKKDNGINKDIIINTVLKNEIIEEIPKEYLGYEVIAKLQIPKIDLNTPVLKEYSENAMNICITKFWGPNPNEIGNFCIIGHNYQKENMFNNLIDLKIGDEIYLSDSKNGKNKYIVYDIYKVKNNNTEPLNENNNGKKEITLITCVNYTNNRLIIKAINMN